MMLQKISFRGLFGEKRPSEPEAWLDLAETQIETAKALLKRDETMNEAKEWMRGANRSVSRAILATPTKVVGVPE